MKLRKLLEGKNPITVYRLEHKIDKFGPMHIDWIIDDLSYEDNQIYGKIFNRIEREYPGEDRGYKKGWVFGFLNKDDFKRMLRDSELKWFKEHNFVINKYHPDEYKLLPNNEVFFKPD